MSPGQYRALHGTITVDGEHYAFDIMQRDIEAHGLHHSKDGPSITMDFS